MTGGEALSELFAPQSIHRVDRPGDLYRIDHEREGFSDETLLVRFLGPESDPDDLYEEDLQELEVIFYNEATSNRWNIQLIWACREGTDLEDEIRNELESETRYAIRRVIAADELESFLRPLDAVNEELEKIESDFNRGSLIQSLLDANLDFLFDTESTNRDERLNLLIHDSPSESAEQDVKMEDPYDGFIKKIELGQPEGERSFRPPAKCRELIAEPFTLLYGPNGSGKTSLLDGATLGMVGQIQRGEHRSHFYDNLNVTLEDGDGDVVKLSNDPADVSDRIADWFGFRPQGKEHRHIEFYRVNYHEAGATTRLIASDTDQNLERTIRRFIYGERLSKARKEKKKLIDRAESEIDDLREEIQELEVELDETKEDREQADSILSEANNAAKNLSTVTKSLVREPPIFEQVDGTTSSDSGNVWAESWAEWKQRFQYLRTSLEALGREEQLPTTPGEIHDRLNADISEMEGRIDSLESIKSLETARAELKRLHGHFDEYPWQSVSTPTALVAVVLSSHEINPADLRTILNAASNIDDSRHPDSIDQWRTKLRQGLIEHKDEIQNRRDKLEEISDLQERQRELQSEIRSLTEDYLSITETIEYCPACYIEQSNDAILTREKPDDLLIDETNVQESLHKELVTVENAIEFLDHKAWSDIQYDIFAQFDDLCKMVHFEQLMTLIQEHEDLEEFPNATQSTKTTLVKALRDLGVSSEDHTRLAERLQETQESISEEIVEASVEIPQFDIEDSGTSEMLTESEDRLEDLETGKQIIEQHIPDEEWNHAIDIDGDYRILRATLSEVDEEPAVLESVAELTDRIDDLNARIDELDDEKKAYQAGIERLETAFDRVGGDSEFTDFVDKHMSVITTLFQAFQRPFEFKSVQLEDGKVRVTRRGDDESEPLKKMSSGQRAALALAIFVTNNLAHPHAPPLMMLDEPVAHLDDINTVSFFNLLIELATGNRRQVLFATANEDIAELLERKVGDSSNFKRTPM